MAGVAVIADDILVYGCSDTEDEYIKDHNANLKALLKETNFKLDRKLRLNEVVYMRHRLTSKGVRPDPAKVKAVVEMPSPKDSRASPRLCNVSVMFSVMACRNSSTHKTANREKCRVYVANLTGENL